MHEPAAALGDELELDPVEPELEPPAEWPRALVRHAWQAGVVGRRAPQLKARRLENELGQQRLLERRAAARPTGTLPGRQGDLLPGEEVVVVVEAKRHEPLARALRQPQ